MFSVRSAWLLGVYLLSAAVWAQDAAGTARGVVDDTTRRVMAAVVESRDYYDKDPERYFGQVQQILDPVIDFRGFARSVMGPYASSDRYRSLGEAGRTRLRDQLDQFTEVMRIGLVRTYSKGLLAYGDARVEIAATEDEDPSGSRATVKQLVYDNQPEPYVLLYQMGLGKDGVWQLRNIIIEGVNLGEIYRNQFEASARQNDGNLDAVIAGWTAVDVKE